MQQARLTIVALCALLLSLSLSSQTESTPLAAPSFSRRDRSSAAAGAASVRSMMNRLVPLQTHQHQKSNSVRTHKHSARSETRSRGRSFSRPLATCSQFASLCVPLACVVRRRVCSRLAPSLIRTWESSSHLCRPCCTARCVHHTASSSDRELFALGLSAGGLTLSLACGPPPLLCLCSR